MPNQSLRKPSMSEIINVVNPRTGQIDYKIKAWTHDQIAKRAQTMRAAQREWSAKPISGRAGQIAHLADKIAENFDDIATALEIDTGRRAIARHEVEGVIGALNGWAASAPAMMPKSDWQNGRLQPHYKHTYQYVPYALVGVISPWNFPLTLSFIDAVPALLAGACVMIKPSEITPRFADALTPTIEMAGLGDILQFIQGDGKTGAALTDLVDMICFTGSVETGKKVALSAAKRLIPANLELGGKDPLIITDTADLDVAANLALRASVLSTGQACQSIERVYVPRASYEVFLEKLTSLAKQITPNTPNINHGHLGPFIFRQQAAKVMTQITDALDKGARLLCGGKLIEDGGLWLMPSVLADVNHSMDIMVEETFGPVIPVQAYDNIDEAIRLANDSE
ncbi:MAG TPA: aldehyde dehydrogenase family protein, partial [Hellea balneolensis]|nr:aldehyde dehydrogenase family protein [Hellea balneolensis]